MPSSSCSRERNFLPSLEGAEASMSSAAASFPRIGQSSTSFAKQGEPSGWCLRTGFACASIATFSWPA